MATRWARFARGWLAASIATVVAAFFHVATGGGAPGALGLTLALAFSGMACIALAGKTLSLWRLTISVALSQFLFHSLFDLGAAAGHGTGAADGAGAAASAHAHHVTHIDISALTGGEAGAALGAHHHSLIAAGPLMWCGHALAAIVTIVALRHGERAFWMLCSGIRVQVTRFAALLEPAPVDRSPRAAVADRADTPADLGILLGTMRHRGPPAAHCA
ncbi:hypothetical protein OSC27_12080 [Microbacterium sp. STN6]|uniref:hypothetical protein n=1 Tax=Microbacterium sp. STN6 TaxID=2995588 RepID=UPI0022609A9B|nr:hypothetical protein [Microbacterium sp. STN6]MCX7523012.1 hypothetical protein [Microbacterium sp. STN6]